MSTFEYAARDMNGVRRAGEYQADTEHDVLSWLRDQGFTPVSVEQISREVKGRMTIRGGRIKSEEMAAFCWQLTTMIEGGVPITEALTTIGEDIQNVQLRVTLEEICTQVKTGETFADCVSEFPRVFSPLAQAMILAGEAGGSLPTVLMRLAQHYESRDRLVRKVKGAMAYPIFVIFFIGMIVAIVATFIIPRFRVIFDQIHGKLPFFTQMFMSGYDLFKDNIFFVLAGGAAVGLAATAYGKTETGHWFFSKLALRIPFIGRILMQSFVCIFCRTMATLLGAGVSILEALDILSGMTKNDVIKAAVARSRDMIEAGSNISHSMGTGDFFPRMLVKMVQVGEQSGALPAVLDRTSDYYEKKVDNSVRGLVGFIEPALIVTVGAIVLVVVLALYLPVFSISDLRA